MNIGYDFDGIVTSNTTQPDFYGQRFHNKNPIFSHVMINKINKEISQGNNVYIISKNDCAYIKKNIIKANININKNNVYCNTDDKKKIIRDLALDMYYDDSPIEIQRLLAAQQDNYFDKSLKIYIIHPETQKYYELGKNTLKVLTYNISWENMLGNAKDPSCVINKQNQCKKNVFDKIDNDYDFIAIQEGSANEKQDIEKLSNYSYVYNTSGKEGMYTLYKKKHKLLNTIVGEFEKGRPYAILLFSNICIINVHFGHYIYAKDDDNHKKYIQTDINKLYKNIPKNTKLETIIMMGDFNHNITEIKFSNTKLKELFQYKTVCGYENKKCTQIIKSSSGSFDHVMSNKQIIYNITSNNNIIHASDHLPVNAEIFDQTNTITGGYYDRYKKYKEKYLKIVNKK